ncbi:hypothetical protein HPB51_027463 [Rhipicephalus microplus]|uniref:Uncharacterized protein n=1 Tax=Rhipicephalus microplus TaxID=6941 RepID=A0A9J6D0I9_RHIMP|nr:hypothetical protein HPB51_027463 [Rhipicephalus microplus]
MANAFCTAPPHRGGQPPLSKLVTDPSKLSGLSIGSASVLYQSATTVASKDTLPGIASTGSRQGTTDHRDLTVLALPEHRHSREARLTRSQDRYETNLRPLTAV